ncbi:MAG: SNF2-related protein, partial [Defluviitaleaceae bacterium]|nr:SNF2-related protein [Defluviitaleaceae bacterium]
MKYAISNNKILDICANEDVYTRGEAYYREGKLVSIHARRQKSSILIKAAVKGNYRNYDVSLQFNASGELTRYNCSCASQSIWHGGCKHVAAVLFALSDGRDPSCKNKARQDQEAYTDTLEKLILQEIDNHYEVPAKSENNRLAKLNPYFYYSGEGEAYLTFYVGYSRMYTIKSLPKFLQAVRQGATVRYGNGLEFNHNPAYFNAAGRRWIKFLKQEDALYSEVIKHITRHHPYAAKEDTRELPLSKRNMDTFFDLCLQSDNTYVAGSVGLLNNSDEDNPLDLTEEMPEIYFEITNTPDALTMSGPELRYHLLKGQQYNYFLTDKAIHRMAKVEAKLLAQVLDSLSSGPLVLTGYARKRFVSAVMPKLAAMGMIDSGLCPALHTKMYFDTDGRDIIGRMVFNYGEDDQYDAFDHRENDGPRDIPGEYTIKRLLEGQGFVADAENRVFRLAGSENLFAFMGDTPAGIEQLENLVNSEVYVTDNLRKKTVRANGGSLGVRLRSKLLDIYVQNTDFTLAELVEALESYRAKKKYHRLKDGRLLSLTDSETIAMAESLEALDIEQKDIHKGTLSMSIYRVPYMEGVIKEQNPAFKKLLKQFNTKDAKYDIPGALEGVLRPYQKTGYRWLKNMVDCGFGGILADDMGLGKTLQVLALLLSSDLTTHPALVVAPTSLIYNWAAEIKKFAPKLTYAVVTGNPEKRLDILMTPGVEVFITTYDSMKRDIEIYQQSKYTFVIADEAQNIKNPATKAAKLIKTIEADHRIALTGTPIENTLIELWSLFDFVMPGYLHSARKFAKLYEVPITKEDNKEKAAQLKEQIAPFIMRRLKSSVLSELPPKTETTLMAEMLPEQQRIYTAHLMETRDELKELLSEGPLKGGRLQILARLMRLRQICCHPSLCLENYRGGSGKLDLALETLQLAIESGHRCLLFSQFTEM